MGAIEYLRELISESKIDGEALPFDFKSKKIKKGVVLTRYGEVEKWMYFVNEGIIQLTIEAPEEEKIIDFFFPNSFVCSYTSFITQTASDVQLTALTDCRLEMVHFDALQNAYDQSFLINKLGRILTERIYIIKSNREKDFLTKSAATRYLDLITDRPEIVELVPINKIARYLGIHPESLSRIRREILS